MNTTTSFTYDNWGQVLTSTDANGNTTTFTYDDYGNLVTTTDALGNTNTMTYNIAGNITSTRDPYQAETKMTYNNADELIRMVDPLGNAMQMSYDSRGAITAMMDAKQQVTHFTYDALRQPISITGPMNNTVTTTYNAKQMPTQMVDAMNNAVKRVYDDHDWLTYVVDVLGDTTWFSYDNTGQVIGIQMPNGQELTYQYDALDRLVTTSDRMGTTAQYVYDANDNVVESIDGEGNHTYFTYDAMNRLVLVTDANGGTSQYTYDNNGNILTFTDANGHTTTFTYDALNRQVSSMDALGHTTSHVYDANGNMTSITDAKGQTTSYTYDANGQLTQITFADGKTRTFEYDGNGNVVRQKDEANRYTTFTYDALNRLTTKTYPDNSTHQFTYDLNGNMLSAVNANATVQFTYDAAGQVLSETLNGKATTYSYNIRQRTIGITYPGGRNLTEQYDYRGRLAAIVENESNVVSFNYNNNDFLTQRTYQNGTATNYTYDLLNRLTRIMDNPQVADVEMTYDAVGNILSKKDLLHPTKSEAYTYDAVNQLIGFKKGTMTTGVEIPNPMRQIQYVLDAVGNHSTVTEDGQTTTYTANSRNAYTAVSGASNYTPQYDANGNLTQDDHHTYTYDFDNHLISVDNGNTANYTYDALGRRVTKLIMSPTATTTNYYYSGDQIIEERDATDNITATYLYGIGIDDILQMRRNGQDYWYHKNHLGSVVALTNGQGTVVERYEYDPYGKLTIYDANDSVLTVSAVGNIYYFTGREYDFETGLYHYRARSLHPGLGRFMQHDPMLYVDAMGLYHYVGNMPTRMVDPSGEFLFKLARSLLYAPPFVGSVLSGITFLTQNIGLTKMMGIMQIVGGFVEVVAGAAAIAAGVGSVVGAVPSVAIGIAAILHGLDNIYAGWRTLDCGTPQDNFTTQGFQFWLMKAGWSEDEAQGIATGFDFIVSLILGGGPAKALGNANRAAHLARVVNSEMDAAKVAKFSNTSAHVIHINKTPTQTKLLNNTYRIKTEKIVEQVPRGKNIPRNTPKGRNPYNSNYNSTKSINQTRQSRTGRY
ncbi:MAG: hypothetical protein K5882_06400 [Bacteroidales bacterium]|nr:hypothetical protein [Bacteroidales bacterium]